MRLTLVVLMIILILQDSYAKRKGSRTKTKKKGTHQRGRNVPAGLVNPVRQGTGTIDLSKIVEDNIVSEHMKVTTQVMNWLNKVVDVGKGIANGVCRTVKMY